MAGKRVSLASLAESKVEAVPGASRPDFVHVHPDTVAPTPLNPRRAFDDTELAELGEDMRGGQLQPCVAVNKTAYLKLYPEHADQLPDGCRYVMAAGERRWRAAAKVGLDTVDLLLRHDLTESRIRFLAAVLSENVQRANFNPIEEADGLRAMLDLHDGNQAAAARAMGKSKAWFNQRIGLLRLSDDMVQLVLEGKLTAFRDMRRYAALPAGEQYTAWKQDQEQPRPPKQASPAAPVPPPVTPESAPAAYTAVYAGPAEPDTTTGPAAPAAESERPDPAPAVPAQDRPDDTSTPPPVPAQAAAPSERQQPVKFPYDDGSFAAQLLIHKMPDSELEKCVAFLLRHREKQTTT
ncbi:ParB/RepB/Spo0J family partition protein [Streptomyces olivaceus]|uniref:ParB/RepB/Spo0J family partition protein n=1 Tax=Streptomyces olivaceus TaxID=47716 RepID=UPI001CC9D357|nr:ParB/RepB/Spo0J family partition protein [Streptomyces olivaceus]MBZ6211716.1 ParB/RepB/Spo0J family partition protein [Streptomyces olivaceus]